MCLLLNIVEVATSHSGINLAAAFTKILDDFGIAHKVSLLDYLHKNLRLTIDVVCQILGVTCDNASPNDVMIDTLAGLVVTFPGAANRTRCFTHILNLVVKVILRPFDVPKAKAGVTAKIEVPRKSATRVTDVIESQANGDRGIVSGERGYALGSW